MIGADVVGIVIVLLQRRAQCAATGPCVTLHIAVPLVVLEQDVVFGRVGLDLACFQHQCLKLALADDHIKL